MTELTEFWGLCGLVAPAHGAARLLVDARLQIWGFFDTCFQTTGQLSGSWMAPLGAALNSKLLHTRLSQSNELHMLLRLQRQGQNQRPFIPFLICMI